LGTQIRNQFWRVGQFETCPVFHSRFGCGEACPIGAWRERDKELRLLATLHGASKTVQRFAITNATEEGPEA